MRNKRRLLSVILVLSLCLSLAITASATSIFVIAGIYGKLHGSSSAEHGDLLELTATARVSTNPDTAFLKIDTEFHKNGNMIDSETVSSNRGDTFLSETYTLFYNIINQPTKSYHAHCVQGGYQSESGFVCYTSAELIP